MQPHDRPDEPAARAVALTSYHVRRAVDGDGASLEWLGHRLTPLLVTQVAYRLGPSLRPHYDPEDLVQDAWLVALPRLRDLVERGGRLTPVLLEFMSRTLRHTIHNLMRKHARDGATTSACEDSMAAKGRGVVTQVVDGEESALVRRHIEALDPKDREVLIVRGIEQISNQAAAVLLGLAPNALAMRYRRALDRLRAALPDSVFAEL